MGVATRIGACAVRLFAISSAAFRGKTLRACVVEHPRVIGRAKVL